MKRIYAAIIMFAIVMHICVLGAVSVAEAGWLQGWEKRVMLSVSSTYIDSDLGHFPLPVFLGTSVGVTNQDVSFVFDELTNDANRFKIAVTKDDGTTQVYVEIESWNDAAESAVLWVARSNLTLSGSATTRLYLYYDSSHADNTTYVGDTNSAAAENVWDSGHKAVLHLAETSGTHYDSTTNDNDGTNNSSTQNASGNINGANDFLDTQYVRISSFSGLNSQGKGTISYWTKQDTNTLNDYTVWCDGIVLIQPGDSFNVSGATNLRLRWNLQSTWRNSHTAVGALDTGAWHHWAFVFNSGTTDIYKDGTNVYNSSDVQTSFSANSPNFDIGYRNGQGGIDGIMDEIRISNTARSAAWHKASTYAGNDAVITLGSEKTQTTLVLKDALLIGATLK